MKQALILCPVYNDGASFNLFAAAVEKLSEAMPGWKLSFLVVDDGSEHLQLDASLPVSIIHLHRNLGHQKAIAIGLAYAHHHVDFDRLIVMDSDGEDRPEDIRAMLLPPDAGIVVARRASRKEGLQFRFFYTLYKVLFALLTGKRISFGNFISFPRAELSRLVYFSEVWNHLAAALVKSKLHYNAVETHRGTRYAGESKMNFTALFLHGLGAIGVFVEVIAGRLLLFSFLMILIALAAIGVVLYIKYFTALAIPGWATTTLSTMVIVILQSFLLSLFTIFLYLSSQSGRKFIPATHYMDYVRSIVNGLNGK